MMTQTTRCYAVVRRADASVIYLTARSQNLQLGEANTLIAWTPDLGPAPWDIYAYDVLRGMDGWIGETNAPRFIDDGILPDMSRSPTSDFWDKHFPNVPPVARS